MRDILFLAHRIPYPPDKGDKIRAWHVLRHLAARHRVHLGTFVDAPNDVRHIGHLESVCASVFWRPLNPRRAKLRSLRGLLGGVPLTQCYYDDARFRADVAAVIARERPEIFYVFCSAMAPYVLPYRAERMILDMVDVDSEKWRQYATGSTGLLRRLYGREGRTLLELERNAARAADTVTLVSPAEVALFTGLAPEVAARVRAIGNGVDIDYFDPSLRFDNPFDERPAVVFIGAMDYRPNVEAMMWFCETVMPLLRVGPVAPRLWIVGANPSRVVLALAGPDVSVTGRVADVRPYLANAAAVVAPLRIARGVQNKVLEAMAMAATVIVTPQIRGALDPCSDDEVLVAESPTAYAAAITEVLGGGAAETGVRARRRIVRDYRWDDKLAALDRLIDEELAIPGATATPAPTLPIVA